ncbi:MAG: NADase-type glycan-binding domain-containing protein [Nocardioides sp.]
MSDPNQPGDLPPDASPEYAEAYRRAYERALRGDLVAAEEPSYESAAGEVAPDEAHPEQTQQIEGFEHLFAEESPRRPYDAPTHRDDFDGPAPDRPAWLVPALLAGAVAVLLLGAYLAGLSFSSSVGDADVTPEEPDGVVLSEDGSTTPKPSKKPEQSDEANPVEDRYDGRTDSATIGGASASCESAPSVDSAGNQIRYAPANTYDGDLSTAWRCDGDGVGQTLTLALPGSVEIGEVGLVPGYAKTDPRSGVDRYAENNRITRVRWTFSDGTSIVQRLDGSATNRELQSVRIPLTETDQVVVEVLAATKGARNTIAVSEVRIGAAAG